MEESQADIIPFSTQLLWDGLRAASRLASTRYGVLRFLSFTEMMLQSSKKLGGYMDPSVIALVRGLT